MAKADISKTLEVDRDKLFATITRYEDYPEFVEGCTGVKVERKGPGQARVTYSVSMMKDIVYTLDMKDDQAAGTISWDLVDSDMMKKNSGRWQLKSAGAGKTDIYYEVELDFKIPVPSLILNRLVKGSLPAMVKNFEKRAQSR